MSQGKGRTPKTKAKRSCLSPVMQAEAERRAMKKALKKYPDDPQKAKVEAQLILLGAIGQKGYTFGR